MICKQCGNEVAPDAKFCAVCGAPVEIAEPQFAQPVEQPQQYAQPVEQPQQYAQPIEQPQYGQPVDQVQYGQAPYQPVEQPQQYAQPQYQQPQYAQPQYAQPQYGAPVAEDPVERNLSKSLLVFGILGIAFGCTYYLSFLGIVFGAIALSKAKAYVNNGYVLTGRAKVGKILGLVGMILGIVLTVILLLVILFACIYAATSYSNYNYYY